MFLAYTLFETFTQHLARKSGHAVVARNMLAQYAISILLSLYITTALYHFRLSIGESNSFIIYSNYRKSKSF